MEQLQEVLFEMIIQQLNHLVFLLMELMNKYLNILPTKKNAKPLVVSIIIYIFAPEK